MRRVPCASPLVGPMVLFLVCMASSSRPAEAQWGPPSGSLKGIEKSIKGIFRGGHSRGGSGHHPVHGPFRIHVKNNCGQSATLALEFSIYKSDPKEGAIDYQKFWSFAEGEEYDLAWENGKTIITRITFIQYAVKTADGQVYGNRGRDVPFRGITLPLAYHSLYEHGQVIELCTGRS